MLQTIREKLTGWVAVALLGAIALTLVISFGNVDTGLSSGQPAATVNGDDITMREFRRVYDQQRQQWEQAYRTEIPDELADDLANGTLQRLISNKVISQYVEQRGYRVSDAEVIA